MVINPNLIGKEFAADIDTSVTWKVEGVVIHGTILILGSTWDQASNRTRLHTFNLKEIKFKGQF